MTNQLLLYWLSWSWSFSTKFVAVEEDQHSQHYDTYDADNNSGFDLIHNFTILIENLIFLRFALQRYNICSVCFGLSPTLSDFLRQSPK